MPFVSIICPIFNEEKFINKCINSILQQDYPKEKLEFLLVDGGSTDTTRKKVAHYTKQYPFIKLMNNPHKVVPHALNIGIKASSGEVVMRIDGHCDYPTNYVSTLVKYLFELNADNVGAVWNTLPAKDNSVCRAIAIVSSHKFGVGNSVHKVGSKNIIEVDTVPFGCYKREVFDRIGLFDEELIRNQDDEFNARLINSGGKIFIIPELVIDYHARDSIQKVSKMYFQYGLFKPLVNKKLGKPASVRQFVPALFVAGLLIGAILSFLSVCFLIPYILILLLYILLISYISIRKAEQFNDFNLFWLLPIVFLAVHLSYGSGYWIGIFKVLLKQKFSVEITR